LVIVFYFLISEASPSGFSRRVCRPTANTAAWLCRVAAVERSAFLSSIGKISLTLNFATFPDRGKQELLPYFKASPCLKKNSVNFIFFSKNCQPLRGFPLPAENFAYKIFFGKNCQPLRGFPSGGSSATQWR